MAFRSIAQTAQDLRARRVSSKELVDEAIAAAKAHADLNAFITLDEAAAPRRISNRSLSRHSVCA